MVNTVVAHLDGLCKYCFTNRKLEEKCLKNLKPFFSFVKYVMYALVQHHHLMVC